MSEWRPDLRDDEDPVRSALELGLAPAAARCRRACSRAHRRAPGVRLHFMAGERARGGGHAGCWQSRRWWRGSPCSLRCISSRGRRARRSGSVVRVEHGSLQTARNFFRKHDLEVGADVPSLEGINSGGTTLIAPRRGRLVACRARTSVRSHGPARVGAAFGARLPGFPARRRPVRPEYARGDCRAHRYAVRSGCREGNKTRIRVREGSRADEHVCRDPASHRCRNRALVSQAGAVARRSLPTYGPDWAWLESISTEFEIENHDLVRVPGLGGAGDRPARRVRGRPGAEVAGHTLLHGSVHGLAPLAALEQVLITTSLRYEVRR